MGEILDIWRDNRRGNKFDRSLVLLINSINSYRIDPEFC